MTSLIELHLNINLFLQDPEFYEYLKEHDKELLEFNDEDIDVSVNQIDLWFHVLLWPIRKLTCLLNVLSRKSRELIWRRMLTLMLLYKKSMNHQGK